MNNSLRATTGGRIEITYQYRADETIVKPLVNIM